MSASSLPQIAIAVVSWNTRELLDGCLRSLEREAGDRTEVWVVDNASADGSADLVRERFPWAKLIASERNIGFGAAVNLVAERTGTPWLVAANADVEIEAGAVGELLAAAERHPDAGALAPRLTLPDGSTQHSVYPFPTLPLTLAFNLGLASVVPGLGNRLCLEGHWDPEAERRVPWAIGAFLMLRRRAWEEAGGFSKEQWMYAEDLDLGWRLARYRRPTVYVPSAAIRHRSAASTSQLWGDRPEARWLAATYAWMLRRRGATRTRAAAAVNILGASVRAAAYAAAAIVAPGRYRRPCAQMRRWARLHRVGLLPRAEILRRCSAAQLSEDQDPVPDRSSNGHGQLE